MADLGRLRDGWIAASVMTLALAADAVAAYLVGSPMLAFGLAVVVLGAGQAGLVCRAQRNAIIATL